MAAAPRSAVSRVADTSVDRMTFDTVPLTANSTAAVLT